MQIEADQSVCPACGAEGLEIFPVLHHMMCAYVGPQYDFTPGSRWIYLSEMPARHCLGRPRLRDRGDKRALCPMWQGNGGVATRSIALRGELELMTARVTCGALAATIQVRVDVRSSYNNAPT